MRPILLSVVVVVVVVVAVAAGSETQAADQVIGTSDAQACYEAATFNPQASTDAPCDVAIKRGKLSRPQLAATYSNRGIILANHGELDRAIEDQNTAIALDPDSARAHVNRGNVYYRSNRHNEAVADYNQAITLSKGQLAPAYFNRAKSHLALGETDAAAKDFQQAAALAPETYK